MRLDHPIFQGPLAPAIEIGGIDTPAHYRSWHGGRELPEKLPAWTVQSGEPGKSVDFGLVSSGYGYEDSPDAEWISGGVNSKGPWSMALGRQGNWFLWGFAGDPTQMTASARRVFVNTIVWMDRFDGRAPLHATGRGAAGRMSPRDEVLNLCCTIEKYGGQERMQDYLRSQLSERVLDEFGLDAAALSAYFGERIEYVLPAKSRVKLRDHETEACRFDVDETLEGYRVSNRRPEFLDLMQRLLEQKGAADPAVAELTDRYLPAEAPRAPAQFRRWVADRRGRLYFSDFYGYRWFVAPEGLPSRPTAGAIPPAAPSGSPPPSGAGGPR